MKKLASKLFNLVKRITTYLYLAVAFYVKTRDVNLALELVGINRAITGVKVVRLNRDYRVALTFMDFINTSSERDQKLKRRYLLSLLPKDESVLDSYELNARYRDESDRLTVRPLEKAEISLKRFIRDLPTLPFAVLLIVLAVPANKAIQRHLGLTKKEGFELISTVWDMVHGFLTQGHSFEYIWPFYYGDSTKLSSWTKLVRYSMVAVPFACRQQVISDFRKQRNAFRAKSKEYTLARKAIA
ncbi:hypothetical protein NMR92_001275 [Vibrio cholerae]|uniref:Uncharacterized protein n=1 Tax=Vibrio parahaemolyticus TaxID=670 RepID=A0A1B1LRP2_VIBPH|nr:MULTISPECIES: hypothetical protein [Vibrio]ANS55713.1 hypothetical protein [Vibrio parahaemolyticus]EJL6490375.1 hypothetical protein [Vibrio cholerae]EJL6642065.1 hypothetical protein [Vibrio cholerae]MBL4245112.1 hypothetical protein [Vibrio fluvialis]MBL4254046.1 hypothetical protein [Vibrio fluvialis]